MRPGLSQVSHRPGRCSGASGKAIMPSFEDDDARGAFRGAPPDPVPEAEQAALRL